MRRVLVRHVIELAAGLNGLAVDDLIWPVTINAAEVRDAALMVASLHCLASTETLARIFDMNRDRCAGTISCLRLSASSLDDPEFEDFTNTLHLVVVRLKAAWRREAFMARWRAAQKPPAIHRGKYQRPPLQRGPREWNPPKSFWNVETPAPVGAERNAA